MMADETTTAYYHHHDEDKERCRRISISLSRRILTHPLFGGRTGTTTEPTKKRMKLSRSCYHTQEEEQGQDRDQDKDKEELQQQKNGVVGGFGKECHSTGNRSNDGRPATLPRRYCRHDPSSSSSPSPPMGQKRDPLLLVQKNVGNANITKISAGGVGSKDCRATAADAAANKEAFSSSAGTAMASNVIGVNSNTADRHRCSSSRSSFNKSPQPQSTPKNAAAVTITKKQNDEVVQEPSLSATHKRRSSEPFNPAGDETINPAINRSFSSKAVNCNAQQQQQQQQNYSPRILVKKRPAFERIVLHPMPQLQIINPITKKDEGSDAVLVAAAEKGGDSSSSSSKKSDVVEVKQNCRRPCNCKNSKCLKLYCECFSSEMYCHDGCKCLDCRNSEEYTTERDLAIINIQERNRSAWKKRKMSSITGHHQFGCRCKNSACLKKYCECYKRRTLCGFKCKCSGCMNYAGSQKLIIKRGLEAKKLMNQRSRQDSHLPNYQYILPKQTSSRDRGVEPFRTAWNHPNMQVANRFATSHGLPNPEYPLHGHFGYYPIMGSYNPMRSYPPMVPNNATQPPRTSFLPLPASAVLPTTATTINTGLQAAPATIRMTNDNLKNEVRTKPIPRITPPAADDTDGPPPNASFLVTTKRQQSNK